MLVFDILQLQYGCYILKKIMDRACSNHKMENKLTIAGYIYMNNNLIEMFIFSSDQNVNVNNP